MLSNPLLSSSGGRSAVASISSAQQVANRVGVLGAIQPMKRGPARDVGSPPRRDRWTFRDKLTKPRARRRPAAASRRRHHAGAHLPDHLLPGLGAFRNVRQVRVLERQLARFGAVVVTGDAVGLDQCGVGLEDRAASPDEAAVPVVPCARPAGLENTAARTKASVAEGSMVRRMQAPGLYYRICRAIRPYSAFTALDTLNSSLQIPQHFEFTWSVLGPSASSNLNLGPGIGFQGSDYSIARAGRGCRLASPSVCPRTRRVTLPLASRKNSAMAPVDSNIVADRGISGSAFK